MAAGPRGSVSAGGVDSVTVRGASTLGDHLPCSLAVLSSSATALQSAFPAM